MVRKKTATKFVGNESGAALVTVVMISVLLLIACIAMLSSVSSHTANVTDVVSETKAYYAAESGIQATINVLRGNTTPLQAFTAQAEAGVSSQRITYKRATKLSDSNLSTDTSTFARLSRWIDYNYPTSSTVKDRVVIGESPSTYTPNTGVAYAVQVKDPDRTQERLRFSTSVTSPAGVGGNVFTFSGATTNDKVTVTLGTVTGTFLDFTQASVPNPTIFTISVSRTGAGVASTLTRDPQSFEVKYDVTEPRGETRMIRGKVSLTNSNTQVKVELNAYVYTIAGSDLRLCLDSSCTSFPSSSGFVTNVPAVGVQTQTVVYGNITPLEPYRLQLVSTGYGPNGARKKLETIIQKNFFNDMNAPAAVSLIGPTNGFVWQPGNSTQVSYCGIPDSDPNADCTATNAVGTRTVPSVGVTNSQNLGIVNTPTASGTVPYYPPPADVSGELPEWLDSPTSLDALVVNLRGAATTSQTYYSGVNPPSFGTYDAVTQMWNGITFCEGNCSLTGDGGGILVVTGTLTLQGNFSFKGLILVTGPGGVVRNGAGTGAIIGNLIIAPYNPSNLNAGFLPPKYDMSGGGNSDLIYSGSSTNFNGQTAISDFVQGVSEK